MNREETLGKQLLVDEIAQARAYLEGRAEKAAGGPKTPPTELGG